MNMKKQLFILLLGFSLLTSMGTSVQASGTINQKQERTLMAIRDGSMYSTSITIKGNTSDSALELLHNDIYMDRIIIRLRTDKDTTINKTENTISVDGTLVGTSTHIRKSVETIFQKDEYIDNVPVDKKVRIPLDVPFKNTTNVSKAIVREIDLVYTYDELLADSSFTLHENTSIGVTAFVRKSGSIVPVSVNKTDGEGSVEVLGFRLRMQIFLYDYDTHEFLGVHETKDFGFGNYLPSTALEYLNNGNFTNIRRISLRNEAKDKWIPLGFNQTLGLDTYISFYKLQRSTFRAIHITPSSSQLSLSGSEDGILAFTDALTSKNEIGGFDENSFDSTENEVVGEVFQENGVDTDNTSVPFLSQLDFSYFGLISLIVVPIIIRKLKKF